MPLNNKSYQIPCNVDDALERSYFRMTRGRFCSHHMPTILLSFPLQWYEKSEGGPPCNSMPFSAAWAYYGKVLVLTNAASLNGRVCIKVK